MSYRRICKIEPLDPRTALAADLQFQISDQTLFIQGTAENDLIVLASPAGSSSLLVVYSVRTGAQQTRKLPLADFQKVVVSGG